MPNGWRISISNEIYEAASGKVYEGKGIPPQFEVRVFDLENFYPCLKLAIDKAVSLIKERIKKNE
jgi:hypothetical protein